jgi:hypothetical protein
VASASASDSLNCAVSGASSGRGEGRKIKDALLARETVEQVDDFAGRVKAKPVEFAPRTTLSSLKERLNDGRLPDGEVVANLESEIRKLYEVGGRRFRVALLPTEIPASREPGLRLNPQLRRIPAEMRADLTSAEIAMSGSYFDDVLRDPRRYGIENTTDKVRRPGAVRRRRDAVCTERIVGHSYKSSSRSRSSQRQSQLARCGHLGSCEKTGPPPDRAGEAILAARAILTPRLHRALQPRFSATC